jgi:hypothetical protein
MTRSTDPLFDERIAAWFDGDPVTAPGDALKTVLTTFPSIAQQRRGVHRVPGQFPTMRAPVAAAAVIAVLALGGALYIARPGQPAVGGPTATPESRASSSAPAVPDPTATLQPTDVPLLWTQASLKRDWPGPVRPEPGGRAIVVLLQEGGDEVIPDPVGDSGSSAHPWADIRELQGGGARIIIELRGLPPRVAPTEQWIAYGVVVDDDHDGIADRRIGMENIPGNEPGSEPGRRSWVTDLHTGRTLTDTEGAEGLGASYFEAFYPGSAPYTATGAMLGFGADLTNGGSRPGLVDPFYVWASVIEGGRVVATDYAPDTGWLLEPPSTPEVQSVPPAAPTPQVEVDPVVPGGRLWTTTVINNSPRPATLLVAEDDGSGGIGALVGTATPTVVPANTTVKVTFALPPVETIGWAIFVNPGTSKGGDVLTRRDVPAYGELRIEADGTPGWRSLVP